MACAGFGLFVYSLSNAIWTIGSINEHLTQINDVIQNDLKEKQDQSWYSFLKDIKENVDKYFDDENSQKDQPN